MPDIFSSFVMVLRNLYLQKQVTTTWNGNNQTELFKLVSITPVYCTFCSRKTFYRLNHELQVINPACSNRSSCYVYIVTVEDKITAVAYHAISQVDGFWSCLNFTEIWRFHGDENPSRGLLGYVTVWCSRIPTFLRTCCLHHFTLKMEVKGPPKRWYPTVLKYTASQPRRQRIKSVSPSFCCFVRWEDCE